MLTLTLYVTASLGVILGLLYLKGLRKPLVIGAHVLFGLAALGQLAAVVLHSGRGMGQFGIMAAGLFAVALPLAILSALLARRAPRTASAVLAAHVCTAITAFVLFLAWRSGA